MIGSLIFLFALILTIVMFFQNCSQLKSNIYDFASSTSPIDDIGAQQNSKFYPGDFSINSSRFKNVLLQKVPTDCGIFVNAQTGSDNNSGYSSKDSFRTIERAQKMLDQNYLSGCVGNIYIFLSGTFYLSNPLKFESIQGLSDSKFVIFTTLNGGIVRLTGANTIKNTDQSLWKKVRASGHFNVYANERQFQSTRPLNVFMNDLKLKRSRSTAPLICSSYNSDYSVNLNRCNLPLSMSGEVDVVKLFKWITMRCPAVFSSSTRVTGRDCLERMMAATRAKPPNSSVENITYLENHKDLIDGPDQWAYSATTKTLYLSLSPDQDPNNASIAVPDRTQLMRLNGARNIVFRGLHFDRTAWTGISGYGYKSLQADVVEDLNGGQNLIPAAIECVSCDGVVFLESSFTDIGSTAIEIGPGSKSNLIFNNQFKNIAASAIRIGESVGIGSEFIDPQQGLNTTIVTDNIVEDNLIDSAGNDFFSSPGIFQMYGVRTLIRNNTLVNLPYSAISIGWGWTDRAASNSSENLINRNFIANIMGVLQDGGGIYTLSRQDATFIKSNWMQDIQAGWPLTHDLIFANGIYLDNGSSYLTIQNNAGTGIVNALIFQQNSGTIANHITILPNDENDETVKRNAGVRTWKWQNQIGYFDWTQSLSSLPSPKFLGLYAPQNSIHGRSYINPLTNTMGCPAGASSIQIFGSAVDAPLFLCFSLNPSESRYLFGGIFSTNHHVNPATNDLSCPAGYQRSQIYGDPVFDFPLYVCFKNRTSETEIDSVPFGGIFGESSGGIYFKNPFANNLRSCPAKTKPFEMLNYTGTDYPLWLCSQPPGMAQ